MIVENEAEAKAAAQVAAQQAGDPSQFQNELLKVKIVGTLKSEPVTDAEGIVHKRAIVQETAFPVPVGAPRDQVILLVWRLLVQTGGVSLKLSDSNYRLYPFSEFESIDVSFGVVTGVTL